MGNKGKMELSTPSLPSTANNTPSFSPTHPALQDAAPSTLPGHFHLPGPLVPVPDWISSRASHSSRAWRCSSLIPAQGKGYSSQIWVADTEWGFSFLPPTLLCTLEVYISSFARKIPIGATWDSTRFILGEFGE